MQVRIVIFFGGDDLDVVVRERDVRNVAITVFLTTAPA
jgi:hypothetical protein